MFRRLKRYVEETEGYRVVEMEDDNRISGSMHIILVQVAYMFLVD
jgi:hypothetical protein